MLHLRELNKTDEPPLTDYLNNPHVVRYLSSRIPQPYTAADAHWWVETGCKDNAIVRAIDWHGEFCGVIGVYLQDFEYAHSAELGYWLAEGFWQKGIATQAVNAFCAWLFQSTVLHRIFNPVTASNKASIRVMEKAGFCLEGVLKNAVCHQGQYYDEHLYTLLKVPKQVKQHTG